MILRTEQSGFRPYFKVTYNIRFFVFIPTKTFYRGGTQKKGRLRQPFRIIGLNLISYFTVRSISALRFFCLLASEVLGTAGWVSP